MSKNAEGWIRHRGGKCPVGEGVKVDYRMRNNRQGCGERAELLDWGRDEECPESNIMAYRLHKPSEQPEPFLDAVQAFNALAKVPQLDGPLQWRDRIAEIDATTMALTTERADLVQKLASEGLALIGRVVEPVEDMSDWRNWKVGDSVECVSFDCKWTRESSCEIGNIYSLDGVSEDEEHGLHIHVGGMYTKPSDFKWHSRPSA